MPAAARHLAFHGSIVLLFGLLLGAIASIVGGVALVVAAFISL